MTEFDVQLILSGIPETACQHDSGSLAGVIDDLKEQSFLPSLMLADTAYGGDENHCRCREEGVDLISPTSGKTPENQVDSDELTVTDFRLKAGERIGAWGLMGPDPKCVACPAGLKPHRSYYNVATDQITVLQHPEVCAACPIVSKCPRRFANGWSIITIDLKQTRLIKRRRHERTDEFKSMYRIRSGIESTNSILKRVTGVGQLRVSGRPAVFMSILLKVAGWNLLRAASVRSLVARLNKGGQSMHSAVCQTTAECIETLLAATVAA